MFKIGNINIEGKIVLAPMAGISNSTYMKICEEMGVAYAITELISSEAVTRLNPKTFDMLNGLEKLTIPVGVQIFGSNPDVMAIAAKKLCDTLPKIDFIDINMGCPVPKVAIKSHAGSSLLKDPNLVGQIVKAVVNAINKPVTVKIRAGWDENSINCLQIAKICEENGASAIALHARTRSQGYSGKADWTLIKLLKDNLSIPVIGNGDVVSKYDAKKMLDETGCDAVMIGRGLLGNPFLIKECNNYLNGMDDITITYEDKINMMKRHLRDLVNLKGEKQAVIEIRSHFLYYLKGMKDNAEIKNEICKCKEEEKIIELLDNYLNKLKENKC